MLFAPIGLSEMLNSGGAVLSCSQSPVSDDSCQVTFTLRLRGCGRFLIYSSSQPTSVTLDGEPLACVYEEASRALVLQLPADEAKDLRSVLRLVYN